MKQEKIRAFGVAVLAALWLLMAAFSWFGPKKTLSEAERRPLAQMPALTAESLVDGSFMTKFEDYVLDQFPLRDSFRQLKSLFHYYVMGQTDNNGIVIHDSYAAKMEYPLNEASLQHALDRFGYLYETCLKDSGSAIYASIVPDKGMYLQMSGYLTMDYTSLYKQMEAGMPWAKFVNLADTLCLEDYYRTDTHWRQENLLDAAAVLCEALGVTAPNGSDYTVTALERPFYGVYYGQAALPMEPDTVYILESELLSGCRVYDWESGSYAEVYDRSKLQSRDLYDVFLSGSRSLLTVENPAAATDRELIVFRDSFGSSIVPLLVQDYARVTLVDIRYIQIDVLERFLEFKGQDVLLLYSTLVLNNSSTIK